jgi:glyoxylase-like metal-dependent hydrolase (beta-lactamase superfamily II)
MKDNNIAGIHYPIPEPPAFGEACEVAQGIFWIRLPLPMALDHVNVFALDDGAGWTIVDTGFDTKKTRAIWQSLLAGPLAGKPVTRLIVTHHHPDHVGLAGWFQTEFGVQLVTTQTAWLTARMLTLDEQPLPTSETLAFWRAAGMDAEIYAKRSVDRPFNFSDLVAPMPLGFQRIQEGDAITIGGRNWIVHIGHGHAPEHATFWCEDEALVIAGDQLLPSISPNLGVYATEPDADPVAEWLESCTRLQVFAQNDQLVLPGHKLAFTGLPFRLQQLIENHHGALERLLRHLATPRTAADCFAPLFKRKIGEDVYGLALVESIAHVNHLHKQGVVSRTRRDDGAWLWQRIG